MFRRSINTVQESDIIIIILSACICIEMVFGYLSKIHNRIIINALISFYFLHVYRFWDLTSGMCVQETHLEGRGDSQLLTCCYATATQLLTMGTYDGSLIVVKLNK